MDTPDLTTYYLLHRNMRVSGRRLAAAVADLTEADRADWGEALTRWYGGFAGELHAHHTIEDTIFFPSLFERLPSLEAYLERLEDEHHELTTLIEQTTQALAAVNDVDQDFSTAIRSAVTATSGLEALLDVHLDFEDAEILPLFSRHYSRTDYDALDQAAMAHPDKKQMAYTVPWLMAGADADEQAHMLDSAPFMLRVLWIATRRRYARLETAALGSTTACVVRGVVNLNSTPLRLAAVALAFAPIPLAGCADDATAQSPLNTTTTVAAVTTTTAPSRIDVVAREFEWSGIPDRLPAGSYPMSLVNQGAEAHEVFVFRNTEGLSLDELAALGPVGIEDHVEVAGKLIAVPGAAADAETTLTVTPGTYQVVCFMPSPTDGLAHFAHGMQRTLEVG